MEMFFRDMRCAGLDSARRQLRFKIDHPLCHYRKDYSHEDPRHFVVIQFSSGLDVERVKDKVSHGRLSSLGFGVFHHQHDDACANMILSNLAPGQAAAKLRKLTAVEGGMPCSTIFFLSP